MQSDPHRGGHVTHPGNNIKGSLRPRFHETLTRDWKNPIILSLSDSDLHVHSWGGGRDLFVHSDWVTPLQHRDFSLIQFHFLSSLT